MPNPKPRDTFHRYGKTYQSGCRCEECTHNNTERANLWRKLDKTRAGCVVVGNPSTARYKRQSEYESVNGGLDKDTAVDVICGNYNCINRDHWFVRSKQQATSIYKELVDKVLALQVDEHFDINLPGGDAAQRRFRTYLGVSNRTCHLRLVFRKLEGEHRLRIARRGSFRTYKGTEDFVSNKVWEHVGLRKIRPWQRPTPIWLGQFYGMGEKSQVERTDQCVIKGCLFPHVEEYGLCTQHIHEWEEWYFLCYERNLDARDIYNPKDPSDAYYLFVETYEDNIYQLEHSLTFVGPDGRIDNRHKTCDPDPNIVPQTASVVSEKIKRHGKRQRTRLIASKRKGFDMERDEDLELNFTPANERDDGIYIYEELRENQDFQQMFG